MSLFKVLRKHALRAELPTRSAAVDREYGIEKGFTEYHRWCRQRCTRAAASVSTDLMGLGFARLPLLSLADTNSFLGRIKNYHVSTERKAGIDYSERLTLADPSIEADLLKSILESELDDVILSYFGSEYLPYWFTLARALPEKQPRRAFLWHCDKGPLDHLKIILYLNPYAEHGGGTEFLNRNDTERLDSDGYVFCPTARRVSDIQSYATQRGIVVRPQVIEPNGGDAVVFQPARTLHRGLLPTRGERYAFTICLLPSPIDWRRAMTVIGDQQVSGRANYGWPSQASELRRLLERANDLVG